MNRLIVLVFFFSYCVYAASGKLPARLKESVHFEENDGQVSPETLFLSRAAGYNLFLTQHSAIVSGQDGRVVRIDFKRSSAVTPVGTHRLLAKSNYLLGADPARWKTGISNYEQVEYRQIYPGIDLLWHGTTFDSASDSNVRQIEHDFEVAPGADPRRIRLEFSGAALQLSPEGDLKAGALNFHKPHAFQAGREVACSYELHGNSVRFKLGQYDRAQPLTIDPVLSFSTYLNRGSATATALDGTGNLYVAGTTTALNFPVTPGVFEPTSPAGSCFSTPTSYPPCPYGFLSKFAGDGSSLLYSTYLGGFGSISAIAVGPSGNVYVAGGASGTPAFPNPRALPGQTAQTSGPFVVEVNADGSSLVYATALPAGVAGMNGMAVDTAGAVYLTGTASAGLPVVNGFQAQPSNGALYKTTDEGNHWQAFSNGLPSSNARNSAAIDPTNPQVIYIGQSVIGSPGLYKTTDGGANWSPSATGLYSQIFISGLAVDPHSPQTVYLAAFPALPNVPSVFYKSTDGGGTWVAANNGLGAALVRNLAIDPTNSSTLYVGTQDGMIYKTTDGAATWKAITPPGLADVGTVSRIAVDPTNSAKVYAATGLGVFKTADGGTTWTLFANSFVTGKNTYALAIDPVSPNTLYVTSLDGIATSVDGGAHWTDFAFPSYTPALFLLVDPVLHTRVWAATDDGIYVSLDSGASWTRTSLPHLFLAGLMSDPAGAIYTLGGNPGDAFVMKLDPTGSKIVYSTYLGGIGTDLPGGIAVDGAGRAYIAGQTDSPDFPLAKPLQPNYTGLADIFVTVLDPTGANLVWSTYLGDSGQQRATSIALDSSGNVHIAGVAAATYSAILAQTIGNDSNGVYPPDGKGSDAVVAKIKGDGSVLFYSKHFGGSAYDAAHGVSADAAGNTYIAGTTYSSDLPTLSAFQPALAGTANAFIAEFNGQSGALQYSTYLGGSGTDFTTSMTGDSAGNIFLVGQTSSSDFPLKIPWQGTFEGVATFIAKVAAPGSGPAIELTGLTDAASYSTNIAAGELVSIFGRELALLSVGAAKLPLPSQLSDVQVTVNGIAAPLLYASPLQVNAQIPVQTQSGTAQIQVTSSAGTATKTIQVLPAAPAIFSVNFAGTGPGEIEHNLSYQLVTDNAPATVGEIIAIYCTGLGAVSPPDQTGDPAVPPAQTTIPVQVFIGGTAAQVFYAGVAPGTPGLYQVNAQIPTGTPSGDQPLQIIQNGVASNTVTVAIH